MKYRYTRIEYNTFIYGTKQPPIAFEVDEDTEEEVYLEEARNNYPNPAVIYEKSIGYSPQGNAECIYNMMIIARRAAA